MKLRIMKLNKIFPLLLLTSIIISCNKNTYITSSWRDQQKEVVMDKLNKVLVVALFRNETGIHNAEDQMIKYLNGKGVASYNYFNPSFNRKNAEAIIEKIRADKFDGAITMRLIDVEKEMTYMPGNIITYPSYYNRFSDYYFRNYNYNQMAGNYTNTKTYTVETNVYSIKEDKIVWTGLTKTTDPNGVDKMTASIAKVVYKKMLKEGFISK